MPSEFKTRLFQTSIAVVDADIAPLNVHAELMRANIERRVFKNTTAAISAFEEKPENQGLTIEKLRAAIESLNSIPERPVDEWRVRSFAELLEAWEDKVEIRGRGMEGKPEHFIQGIPVKSHYAIPKNRILWIKDEQLVGISKIKEEEA